MSERMTGSLSLSGGRAFVTVAGQIDQASLAQFRALVDAAVTVAPSQVTVDTVGVESIDAEGLRIMVAASSRIQAVGGSLRVVTAPGPVQRLLKLAGLTLVLEADLAGSRTGLVLGLVAEATAPQNREVLDAALNLVVTMAAVVVSGADGVSITLPRQGSLRTVAASDDVVLGMEHDQYQTGQGPCLAAATAGERYYSESLRDEDRWPRSSTSSARVRHGRAA